MRLRWVRARAGLYVRPIGSFYMLVELRGSRWYSELSVPGPTGFLRVLRLGDGSGCLTLADGKAEAISYAQRELGAACRDLAGGPNPPVAHYGTSISVDELAPCCVLKGAEEDDVSGPVVQELPPGHVWCSGCDKACSGRLTATARRSNLHP